MLVHVVLCIMQWNQIMWKYDCIWMLTIFLCASTTERKFFVKNNSRYSWFIKIFHQFMLKLSIKCTVVNPHLSSPLGAIKYTLVAHWDIWDKRPYGDDFNIFNNICVTSQNCWLGSFCCDQAALWTIRSVRPPVTPVPLCSLDRIIMQFSGVIIIDKSDAHAKGQCQGSKIKVAELKISFPKFGRSRTITPV